jgi:hypothetical protein
MMLWRILYSPYDMGAYAIMVIGLTFHAIVDFCRRGNGKKP